MGGYSAEIAREISCVARRGRALTQFESRAHQPDSLQMRCVQVLRHALTIANVGDFQLVPEHCGNGRAEAGCLIHFSEDASRGLHAHEGADDFIERLAFGLRRKRQQDSRARGAVLQCRQLFGETHVARTHAGGVDQDQLLVLEPLEHACQFLGAVRGMHGRTQYACVSHQLLARADSIAVGADER